MLKKMQRVLFTKYQIKVFEKKSNIIKDKFQKLSFCIKKIESVGLPTKIQRIQPRTKLL